MNEITVEKLSSDFKAVVGDVGELIKTGSKQTGERIADLRQRLGKKLEEGKIALSEQKPLSARVEEARTSAEARLHDRPWITLAIATGIGLVIGILLSRRDWAEGNRGSLKNE